MRFLNYSPVFLLFLLVFNSCKKPGPEDLEYLSGYWEIREVRFAEGGNREYQANTTIEYFELAPDTTKGYRKKLHPQVDGSYRTSDDALLMEWFLRDERLFLRFEGEPEAWEEEVIELNDQRLVTRHANGLEYIYSRYIPIKL